MTGVGGEEVVGGPSLLGPSLGPCADQHLNRGDGSPSQQGVKIYFPGLLPTSLFSLGHGPASPVALSAGAYLQPPLGRGALTCLKGYAG